MAAREPAPAGALSIGALARRFGLSRSTLLHYDRIGLLQSGMRAGNGYRRYDATAQARLARIVELRATGLSLPAIAAALSARAPLAELLVRQIALLDAEIGRLQAQQAVARALLAAPAAQAGRLTKAAWTQMFRDIGLDDAAMRAWHRRFEASQPAAHASFLVSLGLAPVEVARIRAWSRAEGEGAA